MPKTLALYMRLSSEDANVGESDSIKNQRQLLQGFVAGRAEFKGWEVLEFWDDGFTGTNFNRPNVKRMLLLARQKRINCIIVKDFSRFGRNYIDVCDYLEQVFPLNGIQFISVNDNYDSNLTKGSSVGMDVALKSMISELYSRDISSKIRSTHKIRQARGEYLGSIAFYGYKLSETEKNKLTVDEPAAVVVRRIFKLAAEGMNPNDLAVLFNREKVPTPLAYRKLNGTHLSRGWAATNDEVLWTRAAVKRIVCDERYTGKMVGNKRTKADVSSKKVRFIPQAEWIIVDDTHEPIVTAEQFEAAGKWFEPRTPRKKPDKDRAYSLTGILKCGYCNHNLTRSNVKAPYFFCQMSRYEEDSPCKNARVVEQTFSESLLRIIENQVALVLADGRNPSGFTLTGHEKITRLQAEIVKLQTDIARLKAARKNLFEEYCFEKISKDRYTADTAANMVQSDLISGQIQSLQTECAQITESSRETDYQKVHKQFALADKLTREMVLALVKEIRVFEDSRYEIVWNYEDYYALSGIL